MDRIAQSCRVGKPTQSFDQGEAYWASVISRFKVPMPASNRRDWLRFSADTRFASERDLQRQHEELMKNNKVYRGLDIVSRIFGAYDENIPREHRGGMIKTIK